jgi:dynein heavy chain
MHENSNIKYQTFESKYLTNTILNVQPRVTLSGGLLSNEDIVEKFANGMLDSWPSLLEIDYSPSNPVSAILFKKDKEGRMENSLSTVLIQEADRFNNLLKIVKKSLEQLLKAVKGLVVMSGDLEKIFNAIIDNKVPDSWTQAAYPSLKPLNSWVKDLHERVEFIGKWISNGQPPSFWLSGFFFPQGFLTAVLQNHARKNNIPIDTLGFAYDLTSTEGEGILVHSLFIEGARWDQERGVLSDSLPMEMFAPMPPIRLIPKQNYVPTGNFYIAPLYKTVARAGTLSSTGLSTNFVVSVHLPTDKPNDYWIAKGVALFCNLSE